MAHVLTLNTSLCDISYIDLMFPFQQFTLIGLKNIWLKKDIIQDVHANENWHMLSLLSHASVIAAPKITKAVNW